MKKIILILAVLSINFALASDNYIYGESGEKSFKVIPSYGLMTLKTDYENFNSKMNAGVLLETMLSSRFSVGLLFNFANFKFTSNYNYYSPAVKSDVYSIGINSKFFILNQGFLRPFFGGGLSYNWNKLSLDTVYNGYYNNYGYNNNYYGYNNNYSYSNNNDSSLTTNSMSGILMAGTELRFSKNMGINFDFRYGKTFVKDNGSNYYYSYNSLETISRGMEDGEIMSFNFGLLFAI